MRDTHGSVPIQEDDMDEKIKELRERARTAITEKATSLGELGDIRVKFLGKNGELTSLLRSMSALVAEERPRIGKIVNEAREELEELLAAKSEELSYRELEERMARERIDVTPTGRPARSLACAAGAYGRGRASPSADDHAEPHQENFPQHGVYHRGRPRDRDRLFQL